VKRGGSPRSSSVPVRKDGAAEKKKNGIGKNPRLSKRKREWLRGTNEKKMHITLPPAGHGPGEIDLKKKWGSFCAKKAKTWGAPRKRRHYAGKESGPTSMGKIGSRV